MDIKQLLEKMVQDQSSDLIIKAGIPPLYRTYGDLIYLEGAPKLTPDDTQKYVQTVLNEHQYRVFEKDLEFDFAYEVEGLARFRTNVLRQRGSVGLVFRRIPNSIPNFEELGLPEISKDFAMRPRGLVLVTGPSGCGKSTSMAAMVDLRNALEAGHIMTIEDPIEFIYEDKKALVNQRQVNRDTNSFSQALKHVLRQDPDVIVVGEMRDLETMSLAITAAETGHLVFASLHTTDAVSTIDRIIDVFPPHQKEQIRMQMSTNLIGIISQVLVKKIDGIGRVPAFEIMVGTSAVKNMIREGKTFQLPQLVQTQAKLGMKSMNQSLSELVRNKVVSLENALACSPDPSEIKGLSQPYSPTA